MCRQLSNPSLRAAGKPPLYMANPKTLRDATACVWRAVHALLTAAMVHLYALPCRACRPNLPLTLASLLGPAGGEVTVTDPIFSRDGALQLDVRLLASHS